MVKRPSALPALTIGYEAIWQAIRDLDAVAPWTTTMVAAAAEQAGVAPSYAKDYVRRLKRAGIAAQVERSAWSNTVYFRLRTSPTAAPRLTREGDAHAPRGREQMWCAIRALPAFDYRELAFAASTDLVAIEETSAKSYVQHLAHAGYLTLLKKGSAVRPAVWRLNPRMNTGPAAPRILRSEMVWDQNRNEVMGRVIAEEVA